MNEKHTPHSSIVGIVIAYFLIYVVWGSTYFFIGVALDNFPPFLLGALRFSAAGIILLGVCSFRGERVFHRKLILRSAISGIVLLFVDMAVVMLAQRYVTSSFVAIIASSTALWILVLDIPRWKANFRNPFIVVGSIIGFAGVAMLYAEQFYTEQVVGQHTSRGILLLVLGCMSWALGTLYTKYRSSDAEEQNAFAGSAWQMLFASAMFCICSTVSGDLTKTNFSEVTTESWLSLIYLILFGSLLAYSAYIWLLKVRPATEVATHAYFNPFIAVLLGVFVGGESVTPLQLIGLAIILLGVMLIGRRRNYE